MKNKIKETIDDYKNDAIDFFYKLKEKIKRDYYDNKVRKKYVIGASFLLVLTILIANIFSSSAYYYDESDGFSLIKAEVGDMYIEDFDYTLLVFLEDINNRGTYKITESIPSSGYIYNGYSCLNGSKLLYEDSGKITRASIKEKEVCSIYFNVSG